MMEVTAIERETYLVSFKSAAHIEYVQLAGSSTHESSVKFMPNTVSGSWDLDCCMYMCMI